jgi:hypothetical protein
MSITVYGCVNFSSGTAVITFENLETCLEQSACIIFEGVHAGQIALTLSGATANEACNDTFYGCFNPTTGKFQIVIPEDCCEEEYSEYDCECFPENQTPLTYMVAISGVVNCPGQHGAELINGSWQLQQHNYTSGDCDTWCYWIYENEQVSLELLFDTTHCNDDEDYPFMKITGEVHQEPTYPWWRLAYYYHSPSESGHGCDEWQCCNDISNQADCDSKWFATSGYQGIASWRPGIISCWEIGKNYVVGNQIVGTNCQVYICILNHLSTSSNRPITGESWSIYWAFYSA